MKRPVLLALLHRAEGSEVQRARYYIPLPPLTQVTQEPSLSAARRIVGVCEISGIPCAYW